MESHETGNPGKGCVECMRTETSNTPCAALCREWQAFTQDMKKEAETCLLRAQRDRGNGLYFGKIRPESGIPAGFSAQMRGEFAVLIPKTDRILLFLPRMLTGDELLRLLARQTGCPVRREEVELCCLGLKKMEEKTGFGFWTDYEKQLRQLAAVCLRTGTGGLLWACALCLLCGRQGVF